MDVQERSVVTLHIRLVVLIEREFEQAAVGDRLSVRRSAAVIR